MHSPSTSSRAESALAPLLDYHDPVGLREAAVSHLLQVPQGQQSGEERLGVSFPYLIQRCAPAFL